MVQLHCPFPGCQYDTPECSEAVACALLTAHSPVHMYGPNQAAAAAPTTHNRGPKMERPKVDIGVTQEEWNIFTRRWDAFVTGSGLNPDASSSQLFQCAGDALGDGLLKMDPTIIAKPTAEVMAAMRSFAVIAVAIGVQRAELVQMHQERDEPFRSFAARVRGKAETCAYTTKCTCLQDVDFTDVIIRDVLIAGISDLDIRREILGTESILERSVNVVITSVESKEMARNSLPSSTAAVSSFKREITAKLTQPPPSSREQTSKCPECRQTYALFSEGARGWNIKPHRLCISCYRARRGRRTNGTPNKTLTSEVSTIFGQVSTVSTKSSCSVPQPLNIRTKLTHHIFTSGAWRKARLLSHPEIKLTMSVTQPDYNAFGRRCPTVKPIMITAMADTGAQSCLWSKHDFLTSGFTMEDLIPVSLELIAANKSPISIAGAVVVRLQGPSESNGKVYSCATMVYISVDAHGFYLSREAMVDLGIVHPNFPHVGAAGTADTPPTHHGELRAITAGCSTPTNLENQCSCPPRAVVPPRPAALPFECTPANNKKMKDWLLKRFASSTFNTCPHRPLPCMAGPPVEIHLEDGVIPKAVHTSAPIPIHWQEQVHADLLRDEALGVIERVPYGDPVTWCHRMVVTRKHNGTPRRTVDLSPLNKHCKRETFASESPFHLARKIPKETWKTVTDAWNGYHSVPLRLSDRHLTTFITPFGRWRYTRAPQGFVSSGDGYNRRFDSILTDFERKERCVDDTIHYDKDLETHWWRTIDFLMLTGRSGMVLNPDKLQFAQQTVDFAGFRISDASIEPLPKYLDAIRNFPKPTSTTDIRSWFGLVNQVANYAQLRDVMTPFRPFLSPKHQFQWTSELDTAFNSSKGYIIDAIRRGVEIFDPTRRTCVRPDWSRLGIGYFLSQKHCCCTSQLPDCCTDGWRITLAGSRFLSSAEQRYAPVEGEALAVAWGLEQSKYFTQGCDNLLVVTDHKPLVKILGDRTLDEISNTRIFRLKQRTLPWSFDIVYLPGKSNFAADATSRHPSPGNEFTELASLSLHSSMDDAESAIVAAICRETKELTALSWELIASETSLDPTFHKLQEAICDGFPDSYRNGDPGIAAYWTYRESLVTSDGVILYRDRVVIPPSLRNDVLRTLHSAHQGVSSMESRARAIVFWPGMSEDIRSTRDKCSACNKAAPSQAATPSIPSSVPSTPFESIFADYFDYGGCHYLVAGDRLSGWVEIFKTPSGTAYAGALGLIAALRSLFATFGVPEEMSSDGGPEFSASTTANFLACWGVQHRTSSAYFPQSNGRAEVAVKKAKRILMTNVGPTGSLDNDGLLRALLQVRNTPDPDCNVSPAQVVFGRPIRDAFSFVNRCAKFTNPSVRPTWREAWARKEEAMRSRITRSSEALNNHARPLPPLVLGDRVFLQNQQGPHPKQWDRSGTIVEIGNNDQYQVKVDGSGRVTLRNRRFLRKFIPASITIGEPMLTPQYISPSLPVDETADVTTSRHQQVPTFQELPLPCVSPTKPTPSLPGTYTPDLSASGAMEEQPPGNILEPALPATAQPMVTPARPRRGAHPRRQYVPETGQWQ